MPTPLDTPRLRLLPLGPADIEPLLGLLTDPALFAATGGLPLPEAEQRALLAAWATESTPRTWILHPRQAPAVVAGYVQAAGTPPVLSWVVGRAFQGRGLAREAARAVVLHLLLAERAPRVEARIRPGHGASEAVARACGLGPTGTIDTHGEAGWHRDAPPAAALAEPPPVALQHTHGASR